MTLELWTFRPGITAEAVDLRGMAVHARDGSVGKVQDVVEGSGKAYLVVDTGPWIFGKKITVPAGLVSDVDADEGIVALTRTRDEIENAPEPGTGTLEEDGGLEELERYYAAGERDGVMSAMPAALGPDSSAGLAAAAGSLGETGRETPDAAPRSQGRSDDVATERGDAEDLAAPAPSAADATPRPAPREVPASAPESSSRANAPASPQESGADRYEPPSAPKAAEAEATATSPPKAAEAEATATSRREPAAPAGRPKAAPSPPQRTGAAPERADDKSPTAAPERAKEMPSRQRASRTTGRSASQTAERPKAPSRKSPDTSTRRQAADGAPAKDKGTSAKRKEGRSKSSRDGQPLARYDALTAAEVIARLKPLPQRELAKVERYERRNQSRQTILKRVASLREKEPWRGYDEATVKELREKLAKANEARATAVRDYERRHRARTGVLDAARRRLETM